MVSACACFIVVICVCHCVLRCFLNTVVGVLASVVLRSTTEYVLMEFIVLLLTIYSYTGLSSESEEYVKIPEDHYAIIVMIA